MEMITMKDARKNIRKRKGFILFAALITALLLILVFQASFQGTMLVMHVQRMNEIYNQMECTAKTALNSAVAGSSTSGTFPSGEYSYKVQKSGDTYTITVQHGSDAMKFRAVVSTTASGRKVIHSWKRISADLH